MKRLPFLTIFVGMFFFLSADSFSAEINPANPNAGEEARAVLNWLYNLPKRSENRLVSGHLAGGSVGPNVPIGMDGGYRFKLDEIDYIHAISGQWVGMIGADYCSGWIECDNPLDDTMHYAEVNKGLIDYWNSGGLVIITTHQFDPRELRNRGGHHSYKDWPVEQRLDISSLCTPGNAAYDSFLTIMDRWADGLRELQDHGVVVIWRPFNEIANSSKWWCNQPPDSFIALYRHTFDYLTKEKHLNNLLWTYDANQGNALSMTHYPGDEYVDIVGYTMNWDSGPVAQPRHPLPHKVFGCVEFNVRTDLRWDAIQRDYDYRPKIEWVKNNLPYCSFFMSWDRVWGPYGRGTPDSIIALYNDPAVANRADINWRSFLTQIRR